MTRLRLGPGIAVAALGAGLLVAWPASATDWRTLCSGELDPARLQACEAAVASTEGSVDELLARRGLAWALLRNGEEPRAIDLFIGLAALQPDNAQAQFDTATAHATVWNYQAASGYLTAAVRLGRQDASAYLLGAIIFEHLAKPAEAFVFHHRLAKLGESSGMFDLAQDFAKGRGTRADAVAARAWYERAADQGHVGAMLALAEAYRSGGLDLTPDAALAASWEAKAEATRGGPSAD